MIAQNQKCIGTLPFSSFKVELTPKFNTFSLSDIGETFSLMAEVLEHVGDVLWDLKNQAYRAGHGLFEKSREETEHDNGVFVSESNTILPLMETQIAALVMTARALAGEIEGMKGSEGILLPGEKRRA